MDKESYVSFAVASKLKQKGFYWDCDHYYKPNGEIVRTSHTEGSRHINSSVLYEHQCLAPTQAMACRWLREEHKIDVSVTPDDGSWWIRITELESWSSVFNDKVVNSDDIKYAYQGDTSTKEGCYEAALDYVLSYLI